MSGRGPACEARTHTGRSAGKQKKGERRSDPVAAKRGQWGLRCASESLANLVLTQQWQVQQDLEGLRVGRHHNELRNATIQRQRRWGTWGVILAASSGAAARRYGPLG